MSSALERLRALSADGVVFSRNRHFELFRERANRRALSLSRYLDALAEEIAEGHARESLSVTLTPSDEGPYRLDLTRADLGVKHTAHLHPDELEALGERGDVAETLALYGVELPSTGS